jgi:hypothetical protein
VYYIEDVGYLLAHIDALQKEVEAEREKMGNQHDENCDSLDLMITGKPCNCYMYYRGRAEKAEAELAAVKIREIEIRKILWLGHGHTGLYGDDGEMQCSVCVPVWDYKRHDLVELIVHVMKLLISRAEGFAEDLAAVKGERDGANEEVLRLQHLVQDLSGWRDALE